jgi:hypothetical protein
VRGAASTVELQSWLGGAERLVAVFEESEQDWPVPGERLVVSVAVAEGRASILLQRVALADYRPEREVDLGARSINKHGGGCCVLLTGDTGA